MQRDASRAWTLCRRTRCLPLSLRSSRTRATPTCSRPSSISVESPFSSLPSSPTSHGPGSTCRRRSLCPPRPRR
eukprot:3820921-Prymnesium_polylepis.1